MSKKTYEERLYVMTKQFTTQDTQRLIDAHMDAAGLFLMPVFAGMIGLGRILYGFNLTDRQAFLKFAQYRMKMQKALAEILYDNVRAGLIVQWVSEVRITLVAWADSPPHARLYWRDEKSETGLFINAGKMARIYISAVQNLPEYSKTERHIAIRDEAVDDLREQVARFRTTLQGE